MLLIGASVGYGVVRGGHSAAVAAGFADIRDAFANVAGFRIAAVALAGNRQITREEILATAGVTGRTSLFFFDVDAARARLKTNPWIADATVLKLYPDRLQVNITEREPFALWQIGGKVSVVAADGTVLEPYVAQRFTRLPFVVGRGAHKRAKGFLAELDRHPAIRAQVRAAILVAERRWNLRLRNGLDVRLPEDDVAGALQRLVALDAGKQLLSRDIVVVDLRLADRVTVRLSDEAAKAREDALKAAEKARRKGGAA
jgi:cell division protein FtsQ